MSLEILDESNLSLILSWRNAPNVRRVMYTHHEISADEHQEWFMKMKEDPSRFWYLYRDEAELPQGVVYLTTLDLYQKAAFWGFYSSPDAPPGVSIRIEFEALELAFEKLNLHKLNCEVLSSNTSVINLHKKSGFLEEGVFREQHFDGEERFDIIRLSMLANEWPNNRQRLQSRIAKFDSLQQKS